MGLPAQIAGWARLPKRLPTEGLLCQFLKIAQIIEGGSGQSLGAPALGLAGMQRLKHRPDIRMR